MELIARLGDREERIRARRTASGYRIAVGDAVHDVDVVTAGDGVYSLIDSGNQHEVSVRPSPDGHYLVTTAAGESQVWLLDPLAHLARKAHGDVAGGGRRQVTAYMPGRVVEILAAEGEQVEAGQGVLVLEAMKMKNEIQSEAAGVLVKILVENGQTVEGGDPLFEIE
ncbi:MAG: biotin/lipoyl-containing protein [Thermoanaerobaculia bacterium]